MGAVHAAQHMPEFSATCQNFTGVSFRIVPTWCLLGALVVQSSQKWLADVSLLFNSSQKCTLKGH